MTTFDFFEDIPSDRRYCDLKFAVSIEGSPCVLGTHTRECSLCTIWAWIDGADIIGWKPFFGNSEASPVLDCVEIRECTSFCGFDDVDQLRAAGMK